MYIIPGSIEVVCFFCHDAQNAIVYVRVYVWECVCVCVFVCVRECEIWYPSIVSVLTSYTVSGTLYYYYALNCLNDVTRVVTRPLATIYVMSSMHVSYIYTSPPLLSAYCPATIQCCSGKP